MTKINFESKNKPHSIMCKTSYTRMMSYKSITAINYQNQTCHPYLINSINFKDLSF